MTRDEIISMARKAGFMDMDSLSAKVTDMFYHGFPRTERIHLCSDDRIERFAELVAAAEREGCVKVCDGYAVDQWNLYKGRHPYTGEESGRADPETQGRCLGAEYLADAIRARGEKGQS